MKFKIDGKMYGVRFFRREFVAVPTSRVVVYVDNGTFSEIKRPGKMLVITDTYSREYPYWEGYAYCPACYMGTRPVGPRNTCVSNRHGGRANVLFADFHVRPVKTFDLNRAAVPGNDLWGHFNKATK